MAKALFFEPVDEIEISSEMPGCIEESCPVAGAKIGYGPEG
jgi:hypothetical protein